jgi:hypothetical protein
MLVVVLLVVVLLLTAEQWFPFLMNAGAATIWPLGSVLAAAFVVGSLHNPFLLAAPVLFLGAVAVYALAFYKLVDRPALERQRSELITPNAGH